MWGWGVCAALAPAERIAEIKSKLQSLKRRPVVFDKPLSRVRSAFYSVRRLAEYLPTAAKFRCAPDSSSYAAWHSRNRNYPLFRDDIFLLRSQSATHRAVRK